MGRQAIVIDPRDSIAVAVADLAAGQKCSVQVGETAHEVVLLERIPLGHKFALYRILKGSSVFKYGEVIGESTADIEPGAWVHLHNLASSRGYER